MGWIRSEKEASMMVELMKNKNKNGYITQGVSFSKDNERHMELLKLCLMHSSSFSGLVKEMLANKFDEVTTTIHESPVDVKNEPIKEAISESRDISESSDMKVEDKPTFDLGNFVL